MYIVETRGRQLQYLIAFFWIPSRQIQCMRFARPFLSRTKGLGSPDYVLLHAMPINWPRPLEWRNFLNYVYTSIY